MRRSLPFAPVLAPALALAVSVAAGLTAGPGAALATVVPPPRVVVIVGPVGGLTPSYRAIGAAAARAAARWTPDVITLFSPKATWPAVRRALRGASVVVYLGHGNGFPSRYRKALYPATQDGLGLDPVAGGDGTAHQYFGEGPIARWIRLAPHAVVLLHHLCYASGASEPGLPEGAPEIARRRVDNYAAGWLRAGAEAVIADTFGDPGDELRGLLGSDRPVDRIWRDVPTFHDHVSTFASVRAPGFQAAVDPTGLDSGFHRSIVWRPGLRATDVRAGAALAVRSHSREFVPGPSPTTVPPGVLVGPPTLIPVGPPPGALIAGGRAVLELPVSTAAGVSVPVPAGLGVRWDPVEVEPDAAWDSSHAASVGPPGPIELVAPEELGTVVTDAPAELRQDRLRAFVDLPARPGLYHLVTTLLGSDGVAWDAAAQAPIGGLAVRIGGRFSVTYAAPATLALSAGARVVVPVRIANDGSHPWAERSAPLAGLEDLAVAARHPSARLIGRWLSLADDPGSAAGPPGAVASLPAVVAVPIEIDPGSQALIELAVVVPAEPGPWLLVLDVDGPLSGSLAGAGSGPAVIRVAVSPPPAIDPPGPTRAAP